jgi:hypothetical protein
LFTVMLLLALPPLKVKLVALTNGTGAPPLRV